MDFVKKCKRVWERRKNYNNRSGRYGRLITNKEKKKKKGVVAPKGCLCVYVGPERERFIIKIKITNHPLFRKLLDGAEREYGYINDGPLWIPCDVDMFSETLVEIESTQRYDMGCGFPIMGDSHSHSPSSASN